MGSGSRCRIKLGCWEEHVPLCNTGRLQSYLVRSALTPACAEFKLFETGTDANIRFSKNASARVKGKGTEGMGTEGKGAEGEGAEVRGTEGEGTKRRESQSPLLQRDREWA